MNEYPNAISALAHESAKIDILLAGESAGELRDVYLEKKEEYQQAIDQLSTEGKAKE